MILLKDVHKSFGPKHVLQGINLAIPNGKITCIIGKSGSGKSVLLKHIVGLLTQDQGEVQIDGYSVDSMTQKELFDIFGDSE